MTSDPVKRFTVTLEEDLYDKLKAVAEVNRRSLAAQAAISIERDMAHLSIEGMIPGTPD